MKSTVRHSMLNSIETAGSRLHQCKEVFLKSLVCCLLSFVPLLSQAEHTLEFNYWYTGENNKDQFTATADNCGMVYKLTMSHAKADYQIQITADGVNLNAKTTDFASDVTDLSFQQSGEVSALKYSGSEGSLTIYLSLQKNSDGKFVISSAEPSGEYLSIRGHDYNQIETGTTSSFQAVYCSSTGTTDPTGTYQWQTKAKGEKWTDVTSATTDSLAVLNAPDSSMYRVVVLSGTDTSLYSNDFQVIYSLPGIRTKVENTYKFSIQEYEIDNKNAFIASVDSSWGITDISSCKLQYSYNGGAWTDVNESSSLTPFTVVPTQNADYRMVVVGKDTRPGKESNTVELINTFVMRIRYSADSASVLDTLWYDNFGTFIDKITFTIANDTFSTSLTDVNGTENQIMAYWAPDYYGSVLNHDFALNDPWVGDNTPGECDALSYKPYRCWSNGYRVEDGFYAILPNPYLSNGDMPDKDYWYGTDHSYLQTGSENGGMLFVNCEAKSYGTVIYRRSIDLDQTCDNTQLLFNAYINNATAKAENTPVNVRLEVLDESENLIATVPSGNIYARPEADYTPESNYWANLSYVFTAKKEYGSKLYLQLVNNMEVDATDGHVAGNDLLFDDITISIRYPNVEVFSSRNISEDSGHVATCDTGKVALYALNRNGIKTYINNPVYLYQYRKSASDPWTNLSAGIVSEDSVVINLSKTDERFFGYTYIRAIVASSEDVINRLVAGENVTLSCSDVYAIDSSYVVYFGYQGPMGADVTTAACVGSEVTISGSAPKRPTYYWENSYSKEKIAEGVETYTFTLDSISNVPTDTLFYFIGVDSLGCTDTQNVTVHRKPFVEFTTPEKFVACYDAANVTLTQINPATATFAWTVNGNADPSVTAATYPISESTPKLGTAEGAITVTGNADDYCSTTKSFTYDVHFPIVLNILTDRDDSLFCLAESDNKINFKANVTQGAAVTYYWYADNELVGTTTDPVNTYSFDITAGQHTYEVLATDEVCNLTNVNASGDKQVIEARLPLELTLTPEKEKICEGETLNVTAKLNNVLANPTEISWSASANAAVSSATSATDADSSSTMVVTPTSTSDVAEEFVTYASAIDKVCQNNIVSASASAILNKNLSIDLYADNHISFKCLANPGDEVITLNVDVKRGNPTAYTWQDGIVTAVPTRSYSLALGTNPIAVTASDGVCSSSAADASASLAIEARQPIQMTLTPEKDKICEGESLNVTAQVANVLGDPTTITWTASSNAAVAVATSITGADSTSTVVVTPSSTSNVSEPFEIYAAVADNYCASIVNATASATLNKKLEISLYADNHINSKCLAEAGDEVITLNAVVNRGNPTSYTWNDGMVTTEPSRSYSLVLGDNQLAVTASDGVCDASSTDATANLPIKVREPLTIALNQTAGTNPACVGSLVQLTATVDKVYGSEQAIMSWSPANWETQNVGNGNTNVTFSPAVGSNPVAVSVVEANEPVCPAQTAYYTVDVQDSVRLALSIQPTLCQTLEDDQYAPLTATIINGTPSALVWSTGEITSNPGTVETISVNPTVNTLYSVYAVDAVCGNSNVVYADAEMQVSTYFDLNLEAAADEVQLLDTVKLSVTRDPEVPFNGIYNWYKNGVLFFQSIEPVLNYIDEMGTYEYTVSVDNGVCGTVTANDVTVTVGDFRIVPNAFTPLTKDGMNDAFMRGYHVEIFNRYQQVVFEGEDGWDGTYNGKDADPGTYFYRLTKKDGRILKGTIEVVKF